jgi:uncharacterized protein (TIRG00374 family)
MLGEKEDTQTPGSVRPTSVWVWVLRGTLALLVSAAALVWAFHDVPMGELADGLRSTDPTAISVYILVSLAFQAARVVRWGLLITPVKDVGARAIWQAGLIGIPASAFLPLRLGEFVRPVMIARAGVPFATGMASVVVERVADGIVNVGLFFILLSIMPASAPLSDSLRTAGFLASVVFGGAVVFLVVAGFARAKSVALLRVVLRPVPDRIVDRAVHLLETFLDGVTPLSNGRRLAAFLILTALYWGANGAITTYLARSYGLDVPFMAGPFALTCVVFAIMIPAGPAFAGTLELGMSLGFSPFAVSPVQVAAVALGAHAATLLVLALTAGLGFLVGSPPRSDAATGASS